MLLVQKCWYTPIIIATWNAEIRRTAVSLGKKLVRPHLNRQMKHIYL
jgi:hypothetical protein